MSSSVKSPIPEMKKMFSEKLTGKNILILVAVLLIVLFAISKRKVPEKVLKFVDNIVFDILMLLIVIYVATKHDPMYAVITAIIMCVLVIAIKLYHKKNISTGDLDKNIVNDGMKTIPPYTLSPEGNPKQKEEIEIFKDDDTTNTGLVIGVTEKEMESLCMPLKKKTDKLIDTDFSELLDKDTVDKFAKHQFDKDGLEEKHFSPIAMLK